MKILVFGSTNIDNVYSVDHISKPGETNSVFSYNKFPGGKGFNQALAACRAGADVCFAGCIGEDGRHLARMLKDSGADISLLKTVNEPTGQAVIQVDKNGENSIIIYKGANALVTEEYVDFVLSNFSSGDMIVLQNEISCLDYIIEKSYQLGLKILLNPSPFNEDMKNIDLCKLYAVVLNETEASAWAESDDAYEFLSLINTSSADTKVILTLGANGCVYVSGNKIQKFSAYKSNVVDTTAAGDTFTGYLVAGLCKGDKVEKVFKTASAAASIAISRKGAASSIPMAQEVEERIDKMVPINSDDISKNMHIIESYISTHVLDGTVSELAGLLGYTHEYTSRWIKKHFDSNFTELLQKRRCEMAAKYLVSTNIPVEEIITRVGYSNGNHFRTVFKKYYNCLPLEYRNSFGKS